MRRGQVEDARRNQGSQRRPAWPAGIRILPTVRGVALSQRSAIGSQAQAERPKHSRRSERCAMVSSRLCFPILSTPLIPRLTPSAPECTPVAKDLDSNRPRAGSRSLAKWSYCSLCTRCIDLCANVGGVERDARMGLACTDLYANHDHCIPDEHHARPSQSPPKFAALNTL